MTGAFLRLFLAAFIFLAPAARGENPAETIDGTKEQLESIQKRMGKTQKRITSSEKRERSILGDLEAFDREITRVGVKVRKLNSQERDLKGQI